MVKHIKALLLTIFASILLVSLVLAVVAWPMCGFILIGLGFFYITYVVIYDTLDEEDY